MKLGIATCGKIAEAVVGEGTPFPSRSISQLEKFLHEHDIDEKYRTNDSKHKLACRAIGYLDSCEAADDQLHETLIGIIEELAGTDTFTGFGGRYSESDHLAGIEYLNKALAKHGLEVRLEDGDPASVRTGCRVNAPGAVCAASTNAG